MVKAMISLRAQACIVMVLKIVGAVTRKGTRGFRELPAPQHTDIVTEWVGVFITPFFSVWVF